MMLRSGLSARLRTESHRFQALSVFCFYRKPLFRHRRYSNQCTQRCPAFNTELLNFSCTAVIENFSKKYFNAFSDCSSCKRNFVDCLIVYGKPIGSNPFANGNKGSNGTRRSSHLWNCEIKFRKFNISKRKRGKCASERKRDIRKVFEESVREAFFGELRRYGF
jgi:hypothetical protein